MEINLTLDEKLLEEALKLGGHSSSKETVNEALLEYIQRRKQFSAPKGEAPRSVMEANQRILSLLQTWKAEPLTEDEKLLLDEFDEFQAQHPLRFTTVQEEP